MNYNTVIFDFGGVLIDWDPRYLYRKIFDSEEKVDWFLDNICKYEWNLKQDAGRNLVDAEKELITNFPEYSQEIKAYYGRWEEMLGGAIQGTVDILNQLHQAGFQLYGLTNWSQITFPIAIQRFEFLQLFNGIVVSGVEKVIKPNPKIYQILINRYQLDQKSCVFIDDNEVNARTAENFGITGIHFSNPDQLQNALRELKIL